MKTRCLLSVILFLLAFESIAQAGASSAAAREAAELMLAKFGKNAAQGGVELLAARIERVAAVHGEEAVLAAIRRVGPNGLRAIESAGAADGARVARLLAQRGEPALVWVVGRPQALRLTSELGEDAATALCRHPGGIAEPMLARYGTSAVGAFNAVGIQNGRRLAMLADSGALERIGRTEELLGIVQRFGDVGAEFVYNHWQALTIGAVLVAFLAEPEKFIQGGVELSSVVAENAVKPLAEASGQAAETVATEAARHVNWDLVILIGAATLLLLFLLWRRGRHRPGTPTLFLAAAPTGPVGPNSQSATCSVSSPTVSEGSASC